MTSVKNVMAIASHLQFLESSLSNILIEAALKLTTLTDSSIFILIDGPNGRKYAGTNSLTDTFKKEGLIVENGDAEMKIEGEIRVREKEKSAAFAAAAADELFRVEVATSNGSDSRRNSAVIGASSSTELAPPPERRSTRKRTHPTSLEADSDLIGSRRKEKRLTADSMFETDSDVEWTPETPSVDVFFQPEIGNIHSRNNFHMEGHNQILDESPPEVGFHDEEGHMPETSFGEPANYYEIEEDDVQPYDSLQGWSLTEYLSENPKAQTLKAINDASIAEKGSVSYKLLTSLLWDVAKEVTDLSPDVKSSKTPIFASLFEELWNYFPCLDSLQNDGFKIKMKEHDYSLKAHLKKTIASCIRHRCIAKNKLNKKVPKKVK